MRDLRRCRRRYWALLSGLLLLPLAVHGSSGASIGTSATVLNVVPEVEAVEVLYDQELERLRYSVRAQDANGAPDLEVLLLHITDRDGGLWSHRDDRPTLGREDVTWQGIVSLGQNARMSPFLVHIQVFDRMGGRAETEVQTALLAKQAETENAESAGGPATASGPSPPMKQKRSTSEALLLSAAIGVAGAVLPLYRRPHP